MFLSSIGAEKRSGAIDGLARTEELLDATGASMLYLRCGFFFSNLLFDLDSLRNGVVRVAAAVDYPQPWVDPRDIGDVAAARLLSGAWSGRHVQAVHGPEDLTLTQVAGILTEALGRRSEPRRSPTTPSAVPCDRRASASSRSRAWPACRP